MIFTNANLGEETTTVETTTVTTTTTTEGNAFNIFGHKSQIQPIIILFKTNHMYILFL